MSYVIDRENSLIPTEAEFWKGVCDCTLDYLPWQMCPSIPKREEFGDYMGRSGRLDVCLHGQFLTLISDHVFLCGGIHIQSPVEPKVGKEKRS